MIQVNSPINDSNPKKTSEKYGTVYKLRTIASLEVQEASPKATPNSWPINQLSMATFLHT